MDDVVLVQLSVHKGKWTGKPLHYVGKVLEVGEKLRLDYLRVKSAFCTDTFVYPNNKDEDWVERQKVLGVLTLVKGSTSRQSGIVKISPPLHNFNIR